VRNYKKNGKREKSPKNKDEMEREELIKKYGGNWRKRIRERKNYYHGRKSNPTITFTKKIKKRR